MAVPGCVPLVSPATRPSHLPCKIGSYLCRAGGHGSAVTLETRQGPRVPETPTPLILALGYGRPGHPWASSGQVANPLHSLGISHPTHKVGVLDQ